MSAIPELLANIKPDVKLFLELNHIFAYGLVGKKEQQLYQLVGPLKPHFVQFEGLTKTVQLFKVSLITRISAFSMSWRIYGA